MIYTSSHPFKLPIIRIIIITQHRCCQEITTRLLFGASEGCCFQFLFFSSLFADFFAILCTTICKFFSSYYVVRGGLRQGTRDKGKLVRGDILTRGERKGLLCATICKFFSPCYIIRRQETRDKEAKIHVPCPMSHVSLCG